MIRRFTLLSIGLILFTITLLHLYSSRSATSVPGLTESGGLTQISTQTNSSSNLDHGQSPSGTKQEDEAAEASGSAYSRHIVVAKMRYENASWLETNNFKHTIPKIYVPDDPEAPLHVPQNKGHEVMVYLTYLIDHYDVYPDVAVFMHSHQQSWHQGGLLQHDAVETIQRLSSDRVVRKGYMNLRCEWNPGCPAWLHPGAALGDSRKIEEPEMARVWEELFPNIAVPEVIAQPCCSQFALSKQAMLSVPKERYIFLRDWLLQTKLADEVSGRVFEYLWQYIFTGSPKFCPDMFECACDGYGICFEDEKDFDLWYQVRWDRHQKIKQLDQWKKDVAALDMYRQNGVLKDIESSVLVVPATGLNLQLTKEIESMQKIMDERRLKAIERGKDPKIRAEAAQRSTKADAGL